MKPAIVDYKYRCHCVRIEATDGTIVRLTDYPRNIIIGADTYQSDSGYSFTGIQSGISSAAAVMDLDGVAGIAGISIDKVMSGVFDNARLYVFATSYTSPTLDEEPMGAAILGKTTMRDDRYTIEMMMLIDALNQSVGETYTPACPKVFGGQEYAGCKFDLGPVTATGTITSVTSNSTIQDDTLTEAADYYAAGTIKFTTGNNAGLKAMEIKSYLANGTIEVFDPFYYTPAVGDEYEMIPGCRKRLEDCRDKWNNVINRGAFDYVPTSSQYQQIGTR